LTTVSDTERKSHVIFLGPEAENAVPQEQQYASYITASMLIRASAQGPLRLKGTFRLPSAQPDGSARMGKARSQATVTTARLELRGG
jgi:hypothetical protein